MDHKDKKPIKFVKRQDPEHPYCTNWPMSEEMNEIEICVSCGAETSYKKGMMLPLDMVIQRAQDNYVLSVVKQERCIKQETTEILSGCGLGDDYISENIMKKSEMLQSAIQKIGEKN